MSLDVLVDRLTAFEPAGFPVISLYLNTQPDEQPHVENIQLQHAKEVVEVLDRVTRHEDIEKVTLVTQARRTSAAVRFIEDPDLLSEFGGVGALLRYRVPEPPARG
jgi:peptide subunit release factor 1 (eRF1)